MSTRFTLFSILVFLVFAATISFSAAPVVITNSPANNTISNSSTVDFNYSVSDDTASLLFCFLYINNSVNQSNLTVSNGSTNIFTVDFPPGTYEWFASCTDPGEGLPFDDQTRFLTINTSINCPVITTPGSYLQSSNYTGAPNVGGAGNPVCVDINASNVIYDCGGFSIANNGTLFSKGIEVESSLDNVTIQNCNIEDYSYSGISILPLNSNISILNSSFDENTAIGILLSNTTNSTISGNIFENTLIGLELSSSNQTIIQNNSFNFGSGFFSLAIALSGSSSNVIDNAVVSSYLKGILLDEDVSGNPSSNNNITNSSFSSSTIGIHILSGLHNLLVNNTMDHNSAAGLFIQSSSNQVINSTISNSDTQGVKVTGNNTTLDSIHYFNNSGGDLIVSGSFSNDTRISVINNIFDSPLGNYINYTNISYTSNALAGTDYLLSWASNPSLLPTQATSMNDSYLNFTTPVSVDPSSFTNLSWFFPLGAANTSNAKLITYNGSTWSTIPSSNFSSYLQVSDNISQSGIYALVSMASVDSPPPAVHSDSDHTSPRLTVSLDMSCNNNTITTNVGGVSVHVVDEDAGTTIFSSITDSDGEATFASCGRTVRVYANRDGYRSTDERFVLDSCTCLGSRETPAPPVPAPVPTPSPTPTPQVNNTTPEPQPTLGTPGFSGPSSGAVGSSLTFSVTNCDGCTVRVEGPDGRVVILSVSNGAVNLPITIPGSYRLSLVRNGEVVSSLSMAAMGNNTSPTPSPTPSQDPAPESPAGDGGMGFAVMIIIILIIVGGVAYYYYMRRRK